MSAAWVAGSVRARAMARRRLGVANARVLAGGDLAAALTMLAASPYQPVSPGSSLAEAQRRVAETLLWHLRVLAGWLPADGAQLLRLLAGWYEIANVEEHLQALSGAAAEPPYQLGTLATAWPRLAGTGSPAELRAALTASAWGDPGGSDPRTISLTMRLVWAERVASRVTTARTWARGAAALLVARERLAAGRRLPDRAAALATRLLGTGWSHAGTVPELAAAVPPAAGWALAGVSEPAGLWTAEARWWRRLREQGESLLATGGFGTDRVVGAVAVLAADAHLVRAALELAARGGDREVLDALA